MKRVVWASLVLVAITLWWAPPPGPPLPSGAVVPDPLPSVYTLGDPAQATDAVTVALAPWTFEPRTVEVRYDRSAVLAPLTARQLQQQPAWIVATRVVLSEVGSGRLAESRWGTTEAVGVLQTVRNRLTPAVWNPEGIERLGGWPGCEPITPAHDFDTAFVDCVHPGQYLGLYRGRGLRPARYGDDEVLAIAADRAVAAWWLVRHGEVPDVTGGATMYVHRCGGTAYGATTPHCNRDDTTPDIPGARPHHGPIAFRAPHAFQRDRGLYTMRLSGVVDHETGPEPTAPGVIATYLYGRSLRPTRRDRGLLRDLRALDAQYDRPPARDGAQG